MLGKFPVLGPNMKVGHAEHVINNVMSGTSHNTLTKCLGWFITPHSFDSSYNMFLDLT